MILKMRSAKKTKLTEGKKFIGVGQYKDNDNCIWDIERVTGGDWQIKRNASKQQYNNSEDKSYWTKLYGRELAEQMFCKSIVANELAINIDEENSGIEGALSVDTGEQVEEVRLEVLVDGDKHYIIQTSSKLPELDGLSITLPVKVSKIIQAFEPAEALNLLSDVIASQDFHNYILSASMEEV